jgi:hypothetical protein
MSSNTSTAAPAAPASTSPVAPAANAPQPIVSEAIGVVIGNLITPFVSPPRSELRHYHIRLGVDGNTNDFTVGLEIEHYQHKDYKGVGSPCIELTEAHACLRQFSLSNENDDKSSLECDAREPVYSISAPAVTLTHYISRYMLKLTTRVGYHVDDDSMEAQIRVTVEPDRPPSFTLVALSVRYVEPPPAQWIFTVADVNPISYTVGAPMKRPRRE